MLYTQYPLSCFTLASFPVENLATRPASHKVVVVHNASTPILCQMIGMKFTLFTNIQVSAWLKTAFWAHKITWIYYLIQVCSLMTGPWSTTLASRLYWLEHSLNLPSKTETVNCTSSNLLWLLWCMCYNERSWRILSRHTWRVCIIQTRWSQSWNTSTSPVRTQRKLRCLSSLWDGSSQPCCHILIWIMHDEMIPKFKQFYTVTDTGLNREGTIMAF